MWATLSALLGGIGLLLIGMSLMTDGLKLAAGNALRDLLSTWTNTRLRGLSAGFLITAVVQSSSAVTVATIGFANAGMLSLERAIWVIFGSNVGTTMTAWIVALVGFKVNIEAVALPLVGVGALLKLAGARARLGSYGLAVVGFALLFLGIGTLKTAFEGLAADFSLPGFEQLTLYALLLYVGIGFLLTTLMQSSSAAMVVALSAAESGLVEINAAAALVIGANLGTTSTALLTIIGATPNAKRVAISHVCFNLVTATVALLLLAPMLWLVAALQVGMSLPPAPALSLAVFHTLFNVLGVLLMWPLSALLVGQLAKRFKRAEQRPAQPRYLDKSSLGVPYTALNGMALEVRRIAVRAGRALLESVGGEGSAARVAGDELRALAEAVGEFARDLNRQSLTPLLANELTRLVKALQRYLLLAALSDELSRLRAQLQAVELPAATREPLAEFTRRAESFVRAWQDGLQEGGQEALPDYQALEVRYEALKEHLLQQATAGELEIHDLDICQQYASELRRACRELAKANTGLVRSLDALASGNLQPEPNAIESGSDTPALP